MLITHTNKFHRIPVAESARIIGIPPQLSTWQDLRGVDRHPKSTQSQNKVNKESFLTP